VTALAKALTAVDMRSKTLVAVDGLPPMLLQGIRQGLL